MPDVVVSGCWFHYTQALYRNIQRIGLASAYQKNESIRAWLKCFMALPLAKRDAVDAAIDLLMESEPSSNRLIFDFCEYFKNQWVTRTPVKYWNLGPIHLRCNNALEGINL